MKDDMFEELVASVREGGSILRGEKKAAKSTTIDAPDVAEIRARSWTLYGRLGHSSGHA